MFPTWRLKLREAQVAADSGRFDDAIVLLEREASLKEFLPAKRLAKEVAGKVVERAQERFTAGDSAAGWQDLEIAIRLGGQNDAITHVRQQYAERAMEEVRRYLAAGQASAALPRLDKLRRKSLLGESGRLYLQIAMLMQDAQRLAGHGSFPEASAAIERAQGLAAEAPDQEVTMEIKRQLDVASQQLASRGQDTQRLAGELHAAVSRQEWPAVLSAAEGLLALAPLYEAARKARRMAWKAVGMDITHTIHARRPGEHVSLQLNQAAGVGGRPSTRPGSRSAEVDTVSGNERPERVLLWIDAVGGFLVCLDDQIVLGQPSQGQSIAVPILADLSRRHAILRRDGGAYVLEPFQRVTVDGREISGPTVITDGQLIQLGDSVRIRFTKPHALSATARLVLESHHKTQPSVDAVLLMADSCVLGPSQHCHVRCRNWQQDVVLYRQGEQFHCRSAAPLAVEGEARSGPIAIRAGERVEGEGISFTWEMAG